MAWYRHFTKYLFVSSIILLALGDLLQASVDNVNVKAGTSSQFPQWLIHTISFPRWLLFVIILGTLFVGVIMGILMVKLYNKSRLLQAKEDISFLDSLSTLPPRFSSREIKLATANFFKVIGRGGFCTVYEGDLVDGRKIAVKKLQKSCQGQKDFRAEMSTVGNIHHDNIIRLYGFCIDGLQRMLIYEFMANGPFDQWIFGNKFLPWAIRNHIAIDIATGLTYLHKDCRQRIIHFDIKPQNILLNYHFQAKLADFGLAMLCNKEESQVVAHLRGTKGYYAPDFLEHPTVNDKCDVYSFGMVLLEIVGGRKNNDPHQNLEKWFFPSWVVRTFKDGDWRDIVDVKLRDMLIGEDWAQTKNVIKIALWCIQYNYRHRPSMERVLLMLKGIVEIHDPPLPIDFLEGGGY